jgi:hypothetical protein
VPQSFQNTLRNNTRNNTRNNNNKRDNSNNDTNNNKGDRNEDYWLENPSNSPDGLQQYQLNQDVQIIEQKSSMGVDGQGHPQQNPVLTNHQVPQVANNGIAGNTISNSNVFENPKQEISNFRNQYGKPSTSIDNFYKKYKGKELKEIISGEMKKFGINAHVPNKLEQGFDFIEDPLIHGRQIDMIHFLSVSSMHSSILGYGFEFIQLYENPQSAFYAQDLYSNAEGIKFFEIYGNLISQNPTKISDYIYTYLKSPVLRGIN